MPKKLGLLGKKIGMTRIYSENGSAVAVTVIETGPCVVLQKKSVAKEGYEAIQVGFGSKKESRMNKPDTGHTKASGKGGFYHIKEFRVADSGQFEVGQKYWSRIFSRSATSLMSAELSRVVVFRAL